MKYEFKVYKEGVTATKVAILSKSSEPFNKKEKINKYLSLGYRVFTMDDKEIKGPVS